MNLRREGRAREWGFWHMLLVCLLAGGCSTSEDSADGSVDMTVDLAAASEAGGQHSFIGGRTKISCAGALPACTGKTAGCVLGQNEYVEGTFPGMRRVLVKNTAANPTIRVQLYLVTKSSPDTKTKVLWYKPGCTGQTGWETSSSNLFELAGADNLFETETSLTEVGDRLIEITSDATCKYLLAVQLGKP